MEKKRLHGEFNHDTFSPFLFSKDNDSFRPHEYWISLGLLDSQLAKPKESSILCEGDDCVLSDIKEINYEFFNNLDQLNPDIPVLSVDGTCCTGKSTLCDRHLTIKTNKAISSVGMNTHPAGALGYYYESMFHMKNHFLKHRTSEQLIVSDRTPWNNYLWSSIWKIITTMAKTKEEEVKVHTNQFCKLKAIKPKRKVYSNDVLINWRCILDNTHSVLWNSIVSNTVPIFVVDSNEENVKARMKRRAMDSDLERSDWSYYVAVQNYAYAYLASLYPKQICIVDISRYSNTHSHKEVMEILNLLLMNTFQDLKKSEVKFDFDNDDSHMFVCDQLSSDGVQFERTRPFKMDKFYSDIKDGYMTFRDDMVDSSSAKRQKKVDA